MLLAVSSLIINLLFSVISFSCKWILLVLHRLLPFCYLDKLNVLASTLPRDVKMLFVAARVWFNLRHFKSHNCTAYSEFQKTMLKDPDEICFLGNEKEWTFRMVDEYTGKVANVFSQAGYRKGDVVALFMSNCPEYVCLWLGLSRLGVISAFINTNLRGDSLKHCIDTCGCAAVVFSEDLAQSLSEISAGLKSLKFLQLSGRPMSNSDSLETRLDEAEEFFSPKEPVSYADHMVYVFTSGTTGYPKAAIITHARYLLFGTMCAALLGIRRSDRLYLSLPLYHVAGGLLCVSTCTNIGTSGVVASKFSASNFFPDCAKFGCTVAMFIGEMCRYILSQPDPTDRSVRAHNLRMIISTGLRASVWENFSKRFGIENIIEIYGATEGNVQLVNVDRRIGAIGFVPQCLPRKYQRTIATVVKIDSVTHLPIRDKDGFCIECETDEVGMLLGLIRRDNPSKMFCGYVGGGKSEKKIIKHVYQKDDEAYVTGDLVSIDKYGFVYFKDRTGDSYRWKGENVSSFEVETVVSKVLEGRECVAYGVQVGDLEGKAGMVAVFDPERQVDPSDLAQLLEKDLPRYAIPVFLRLVSHIDFTGTWRVKKMQLKKEGFDPNVVGDPVFFKRGKVYEALTDDAYDAILNGAIVI